MNKRTLILSVALALAPALALAQTTGSGTGSTSGMSSGTTPGASDFMAASDQFRTHDKNSDGSLSSDEAKTAGVPTSADTDNDGKVSQQEFDAWNSKRDAAGPTGPSGAAGTSGSSSATTSPGSTSGTGASGSSNGSTKK